MDRQQPFLLTIAETILPGLSYLSSIALVAIPINYLLESCDISPASFFTAKVDIRVHDDMYNYLMAWVAKHDLSLQNHRLLASSSITNEQFEWSDGSDTEDGNSSDGMDIEFEETQEPGTINFLRVVRWTPAIGTHFFRYQNRLLAFTRSFEDRDTIPYSRRAEKLTIHCLGRNADILKMLIAEAQVLYLEAEKGKTAIYRAIRSRSEGDWVWTRSMSRASRPMTTIDIDPEVKDNFLSDLQSYLAPQRKRWYAVRGIPYRRGYLFYGPTGTGKSSLAFAAAGILGLKIYVLSLTSPKISDDGLASLFQTLPQNSMVLLEDVDAVGLTQNRGALEQKSEQPGHAYRRSQGRISLSALLNALDGIGAQEGRVLIMTSNHREHLDPALLRPGRIDHSIRFALANTDAIKAMFLRMFTTDDQLDDSDDGGEKRTDDSNNANSVNSLAELFARKVPADTFSPAEIQGFLLSHLADPRSAIIGVDDWLKVAQAASESGSPAALDVLNQDYPPSESDTCDSRGSSESEEEMS